AAQRSILEREASSLKDLAERLDRGGHAEPARAVRARLPRPATPDGPTRFVPLPDAVPPSPPAGSGRPDARLEAILERSATELFELAQRAAKAVPPRYALAGDCLRAVIERQPDHA